jgi:hypothetical protein
VATAVIAGTLWFGPFAALIFGLVFVHVGADLAGRGDEATASPLSFCLPGYRELLRTRHFVEGGVIGLCWAIWFFSFEWTRWELNAEHSRPGLPSSALEAVSLSAAVLATIGVFLGGMVIHLAVRVLTYRGSRWAVAVGFAEVLPYLLLLIGPSWVMQWPTVVWLGLLPIELALLILLWIRLGDPLLIHQGHRRLIEQMAPRIRVATRVWTRESRVEAFFRRRMERQEPLSAGRYCWGELGRAFVPPLHYWRTELICLAAAVLILGFLGRAAIGQGFVLFGFSGIVLHLSFAPGQTLLLPAGRRERCLATLAIAACACAILLGVGAIGVALSWLWSVPVSLMPVTFTKADPAWFYWPCVMAPWAIVPRLLRGGAQRIALGSLVVAALLLVAGVYLLGYDMISEWRLHAAYACVLISGWLLLLVALRMRYRVGDLI